MAKLSASGVKRSSIVKLKVVAEKLQKSLLLDKRITKSPKNIDLFEEPIGDLTSVPEDVKEGHFAVIAANDEEARRFVVPLKYLTHPLFLKLLEIAEEEYGFDHDGALTIPCKPVQLERILAHEQWVEEKMTSSLVDHLVWIIGVLVTLW